MRKYTLITLSTHRVGSHCIQLPGYHVIEVENGSTFNDAIAKKDIDWTEILHIFDGEVKPLENIE